MKLLIIIYWEPISSSFLSMISNIYFIMHIKTFLRKLNEASSNETINPFIFGNKSRLKNSFQTINPARSSSQTKKFSLAK